MPVPSGSALALALAGPAPAVPESRWRELLGSSEPIAVEAAAAGLLRLSLRENRFGPAQGLLDADLPQTFPFALRAALLLGRREALPRLVERLFALPPQDAGGALEMLETLGAAELRARLERESPEFLRAAEAAELALPELESAAAGAPGRALVERVLEASRERWAWLCDRTGGALPGLEVLAAAGGLLPPEAIEAVRRREADGAADAIRALAAAAGVGSRAVRLRCHVAAVCADALVSDRPRRAAFDRLAVPGLAFAAAARARAAGGSSGALTACVLEGADLVRTCPQPDSGADARLRALVSTGQPAALEAVARAAAPWKRPELAPVVVRVAMQRGFHWAPNALPDAVRIEDALLEAAPRGDDDGILGLMCALATPEARDRALAILRANPIMAAMSGRYVAGAFPEPQTMGTMRRLPAMVRSELELRFEQLAPFDSSASPLPQGMFLHCHACGHVQPIAAAQTVAVDTVTVPDPPVACAGCGESGHSTALGDELPRASWFAAMLQPAESPRDALARGADEGLGTVDRAELYDLAGDAQAADAAMHAVDGDQVQANLAAVLRMLGRRGRWEQVYAKATEALQESSLLVEPDRAQILRSLEAACAALGRRVPETEPNRTEAPNPVDTAVVHLPSTPARNAPCPCGSGKKFKRCHGA